MQTTPSTYKNMRGEWLTEQHHALAPDSSWFLTVSTHKTFSGDTVTRATVSLRSGTQSCVSMTHRMFTDYSKCIGTARMRCTAKSVEAEHLRCVALAGGVDAILTAARAHLPEYTAQTAAA